MSTLLQSPEMLKRISFVTHPKRIQILKEIENAGRAMYIAEIAKAINEETPRNTSFHLIGLSKLGIVESKLQEIPNTERAAKFYNITEKGKELLKNIGEIQINI
ncbi:hypothetical protein C5F47_08875 [Nitrosopumilus cobalaminigenes]|uniref:Transcriptional regulator n=1 Tax=Nitrosopumilus cobalaminigenes TaxID=1470066 RepID=A0A7D5R7P3_9ARCH|nr:hypothetical protein [Nitrosopumilus cobalaminigenes]QLH03642.1 hypothetical protein C5F47_08875 [Nitrosopumilus cobalaminigenes]